MSNEFKALPATMPILPVTASPVLRAWDFGGLLLARVAFLFAVIVGDYWRFPGRAC
jgi:hypothetical protein